MDSIQELQIPTSKDIIGRFLWYSVKSYRIHSGMIKVWFRPISLAYMAAVRAILLCPRSI